jgi:octaprenyl-diphosphate synthase
MGGATEAEAAALRSFGHHLGMAFQIADDLLDFLGDPKKTGKPLGTDLRDGRVTLPLIHALHVGDEETRAQIRSLVSRSTISDADVATVTALIARQGGFEAARYAAEERADRAVTLLGRFPRNPYHDALEQLARFVVARDR